MQARAIVWFTNNLRIQDNEALYKASQQYHVIPVYVFNPRQFAITKFGFTKNGAQKTQFLLESVADLKARLQQLGSDLIVRIGLAEEIIPKLATELAVKKVFGSKEITEEEVVIEEEVEKTLFKKSIAIEYCWKSTLMHEEDVPWPIKQVPDVFTQFRKEAENSVAIRALFDKPDSIPPLPKVEVGELPSMNDLGFTIPIPDKRAVLNFKGGETSAWNRLNQYFWRQDLLQHYKTTRDGLIGADYSSKLSPWLSVGAISAKSVYYEVKKYEQQRIKNDSTYWLVFELFWRDFFKFMAKKHGNKIFQLNGLSQSNTALENDRHVFDQWRFGKTESAFINANMHELLHTSFMSNRGRQIVASYLIYSLKLNWTWGAAWFEHALIDYDPCSNWLNWAYIAGVGNDPRQGRVFNVESQQQRHDPDGQYVMRWT